jgi:chemotaxis signal transduction protein
MSTRLIIVRDVSPDEVPQHFGLIVEGVQETIRREQSDFTLPEMDAAAYISAVAADQSGLLYRVDLVKILACLPRAQVTDDVG